MSLGTQRPHVASYLIFRKDKKVAFLLRSGTSWMNGFYGLPAGKVEEAESFLQAAVREAKEEVNAIIKVEQLKPILTMHREDPESNIKPWVDMFFEVTDWQGELSNAEPHMHSELAWLDPQKLPKNVISSVKFALEQIESGHTYCEYGWDA